MGKKKKSAHSDSDSDSEAPKKFGYDGPNFDSDSQSSASSDGDNDLPMCRFGAGCYRKNPQHLAQYRHPVKSKGKASKKPTKKPRSSSSDDDAPSKKRSKPAKPAKPAPMSSSSDDDEEEDFAQPKKRKICPHGTRCYRKNLLHFAQYDHPTKDEDKTSLKKLKKAAIAASQQDPESDSDTEPEPLKTVAKTVIVAAPSTSKKSGKEEEDDDEPKQDLNGKAPALTRAFSTLNEQERKDLIAEAQKAQAALNKLKQEMARKEKEMQEKMKQQQAEAKQTMDAAVRAKEDEAKQLGEEEKKKREALTKELHDKDVEMAGLEAEAAKAKEKLDEEARKKKKLLKQLEKKKQEAADRLKELTNLKAQGGKGGSELLVAGEKEALEGNDVKYFPLYAQRTHDNSAEQIHFRVAESQFYRLLETNDYRVTKVEYVVSPTLVKRFDKVRQVFMDRCKKEGRSDPVEYEPVLGFHGTNAKNINSIATSGFRVPGKSSDFSHSTDAGWYGRGVYFSEFPSYAMEYITGAKKLLLCQVLLGQCFECKKLMHGADLQTGFDAHMSPDHKEVVIFNADAILPSYVVHYEKKEGDFDYNNRPKATTAKKKGADTVVKWIRSKSAKTALKTAKKLNKALEEEDNLFKGIVFAYCGKLVASQAVMTELLEPRGATAAASVSCDEISFVLSTKKEVKGNAKKLDAARKKHIPIVDQTFMLDCIINNDYDFSKHKDYLFQ